jgi:hypothetical protein
LHVKTPTQGSRGKAPRTPAGSQRRARRAYAVNKGPAATIGGLGEEWQIHNHEWASRERLHRSADLLRLLDNRFARRSLEHGPYFFPDLADTIAADEQGAIDAGEVQATRIEWVGTAR